MTDAQATAFAFDLKRGRALQQDHPFGIALIVPEIRWAGVAVRHDALDANVRRRQ